MIPLVGIIEELKVLKARAIAVAEECMATRTTASLGLKTLRLRRDTVRMIFSRLATEVTSSFLERSARRTEK